MDISSTGIDSDCDHEFLSDGAGIYHFPAKGNGCQYALYWISNYQRILVDKVFQQSIGNTFFYLIIQVPIMLILAILLAQLLNNKHLKLRGLFRTCVFLPCATSLVSYSLIFRSMFATDGLINSILMKLGILHSGYNFLGHSGSAKAVIILALIWRWTGYNMVFIWLVYRISSIPYTKPPRSTVQTAGKHSGGSPYRC